MQGHSRPFKCDQEKCTFAQLGFPTQSHLRIHNQQCHSPKTIKHRARKYQTKKQELKLILIDAVMEDDLQMLRDIWDTAKSFRTALLLTAIRERSSQAIIDFLVERINFEQMSRRRRVRALSDVLQTATQTRNIGIFKAFGIQPLLCSYGGEKKMIKIIQQVASTRNADLVEEVAHHIPPMLFLRFVEILIPYRPSEEAETYAIECLERIRYMPAYRRQLNDYFRYLGARCCSIPIAQFLLEDGADVNSKEVGNAPHSALFAASRSADRYAAEFMKFLLDHGADIEEVHHRKPLSSRPGAKTIQQWLGITWEELVARYQRATPLPINSPSPEG